MTCCWDVPDEEGGDVGEARAESASATTFASACEGKAATAFRVVTSDPTAMASRFNCCGRGGAGGSSSAFSVLSLQSAVIRDAAYQSRMRARRLSVSASTNVEGRAIEEVMVVIGLLRIAVKVA